MQGAVAFSRADVDVDPVQVERQGIDHHGPQDCTVDPGQERRGRFNVLSDDRLIKIKDLNSLFFEHADDRERRNTDDADPCRIHLIRHHHWSCFFRR